jgi:hypothetical protein
MHSAPRRCRFFRILVLAGGLAAGFAPLAASSAAQPKVAVLPLAAADSGMPYGLLPSRSELAIMTSQLRAGLSAGHIVLVGERRLPAALATAGFDQTSPERSCVVAECAQRLGRAVGADEVLFGAVTRGMAVIWGTSFSLVDVRSGKVVSEMSVGYKGDVQAMEIGERDAGACLARVIGRRPPCPPDPGW